MNSKFRKEFEQELQKLDIDEQLSRLSQEAGLNQAQVKKRIGTTASALSRYEIQTTIAMNLTLCKRLSVPAVGNRIFR